MEPALVEGESCVDDGMRACVLDVGQRRPALGILRQVDQCPRDITVE